MNYFKPQKLIYYALVLAMCAGLLWSGDALAGPDPLRRPWPTQVSTPKSGYQAGYDHGLWQGFFLRGIRFFQIFISPADGQRCPMYPSCSHYAVEAIRTYGPWLGIMLTSDRLLRCGRESDYPMIQDQEGWHYYDPLEGNVIWH